MSVKDIAYDDGDCTYYNYTDKGRNVIEEGPNFPLVLKSAKMNLAGNGHTAHFHT